MSQEFGEWLKRHREAAGLSQTQLAEAVGVVLQTVSRFERGVREPELSLAVKMAEAIGAPCPACGQDHARKPPKRKGKKP